MVGHFLPVCCLTGAPGVLTGQSSSAPVSSSIRASAVKRDAVELKVSGERKVTLSSRRDNKQRLQSQINLGIIIIHLCVNKSELEIHFWINSAPPPERRRRNAASTEQQED